MVYPPVGGHPSKY